MSSESEQARKEGEEDVVGKLEKVLSVAMEEKQKTLRPEIQLFNKLLAAKSGAERTAVRPYPTCAKCDRSMLRKGQSINTFKAVRRCWQSPKQSSV